MASYRNIHMTFWTDGKVVDDFSPEDKYVYLWCLTNPHTNLCGCYEVSIKQMSYELGYNADSVERILKRLDISHQVIRYNAPTKELLVLNWCRYNWSSSEKLDKPLLVEIQKIKHGDFRNFLAGWYNARATIAAQYNPLETATPKKTIIRHKHGEYGHVRLTDDEYDRLLQALGEAELQRCIAYVDESAQTTGNKNKWKDWNLVVQKCAKQKWGCTSNGGGNRQPVPMGQGNDQNYSDLERQAIEKLKQDYNRPPMKGAHNDP